MGFDPCSEIRSAVDSKMEKFRDAKSKITDPINQAKNDAWNMINSNEDLNAAEDQVRDAANAATTGINDLTGGLESFTGDCLSPLLNKLRSLIYGSESFLTDIFGSLASDLWKLFESLFKLINIIDTSGIAALIRSLDEMLGCLASSCVNQDLQGIFDEINSTIDEFGLMIDGTFDPESFISSLIPTIADTINEKISNIKSVVTSTIDNVKSVATSATEVLKVPQDFY